MSANYSGIIESDGLSAAIKAACAVEDAGQLRRYAVECCRLIEHLMLDPRSISALYVAEKYAAGEVSKAQLEVAYDAACNVMPGIGPMDSPYRAAAMAAVHATYADIRWSASRAMICASEASSYEAHDSMAALFSDTFGGAL